MRKLLLVLVAFLIVGVVTMRFTVDDGMRRYANAEANSAVEAAYALALAHRNNPLQRFITPAAGVAALVTLPGHCPGSSATGAPPGDDAAALAPSPGEAEATVYAAQVRFYTLYGIAVADLYVVCGNVTETQPPGWPGEPVPLDTGEERDLRWSRLRPDSPARQSRLPQPERLSSTGRP